MTQARVVSIICLIATALTGTAAEAARAPRNVNGSYKVKAVGYYTGEGNVAVGGTNVNVNVQVRDEAGGRGRLRAHLVLVKNRFVGVGTVMGRPVKIEGRVDPADMQGEALRTARFTATFVDAAGNGSRVVGGRTGGGAAAGGGGGGDGDDDED